MIPNNIKEWSDRQIAFFRNIQEEIERLKNLDVKYSGLTGRYVSEYVSTIDFSGRIEEIKRLIDSIPNLANRYELETYLNGKGYFELVTKIEPYFAL